MKNTLLKFVSFNLVFLSVAIQAGEARTNIKAHVHGVSELMIVAEDNLLEIQFKSPAMNLVGFEHQAKSSNDLKTVEKAASTLRQHDSLLLMSDANCKLTNTSVDLSKIIDTDDNDHDNSSNEDVHAHNNKNHDENHSEIMVTYKYYCEDSTSLPSITVNLFEFFTGIEEINTMWINQTGQGAITLRHNNRIINF